MTGIQTCALPIYGNLSGGNGGFVINSSAEVTLENLTLREFNNQNGSAPLVNNGSLNIVDANILNNNSLTGGAIENSATARVNIVAKNKDVLFSGNTSSALHNDGGIVNLNANANRTITFNDKIIQTNVGKLNINPVNNMYSGVNGGNVVFNADMSGVSGDVNFYNGTLELNLNNRGFNNNTRFNVMSATNVPQILSLNNTNLNNLGEVTLHNNLLIDVNVDLANESMSRIGASNINTNGYKLQVDSIRIISDTQKSGTITIDNFASENLRDSVEYIGADKISGYSPLYTYGVTYAQNSSSFNFTREGANPSLHSANVATHSVALAQVAIQSEAFRGIDEINISNDDRYASIDDEIVFQSFVNSNNNGSVWIRPYYSNGNIKLDGLPTIKNEMYGALIGMDSNLKELDNGVRVGLSGYVGYNGAKQHYSLDNMLNS